MLSSDPDIEYNFAGAPAHLLNLITRYLSIRLESRQETDWIMKGFTPKLVIHGGAGKIKGSLSKEQETAYRDGLKQSVEAGRKALEQEDDAVTAVVAAVSSLEDNELFNAGKGAVFTTAGTNELEASIMVSDGHSKRTCAVTLVNHLKNPVKAAQLLLDYSADPHVLLSGEEVEHLAEKLGCETVTPDYYFTQRRWDQHQRGLDKNKSTMAENIVSDEQDHEEYAPKGTVGAVAMDSKGTIACATSTGGLTNKRPGRIGDTCQAGSGYWAEKFTRRNSSIITWVKSFFKKGPRNSTMALGLSGTGNGDGFIRNAICHSISDHAKLTANDPLYTAADKVISGIDTEAGVIGLDSTTDNVVMAMNCDMNRGYIDKAGNIKVAIYQTEKI